MAKNKPVYVQMVFLTLQCCVYFSLKNFFSKISEDQKLEAAAEDTRPPDMSVEANDLTIEDEVNLEPKKPGMPSCSTHKFTSTF